MLTCVIIHTCVQLATDTTPLKIHAPSLSCGPYKLSRLLANCDQALSSAHLNLSATLLNCTVANRNALFAFCNGVLSLLQFTV